jgi:hypothetical protein
METPNGILHWNVLFIRPMHDWELEAISRFLTVLYSQKISVGGEDKICWIPLKRNVFEVKSYYQALSTLA